MGQCVRCSNAEIQLPETRNGIQASNIASASYHKDDAPVEDTAAGNKEPANSRLAHREQDRSEYLQAIEDFFSPSSDSEHSVSRRRVAIIQGTADGGSNKPRRVFEKRTSRGSDRDSDIIEVTMPTSARERKAGTRIILADRFVHDQAFKELDLKITKRFGHGVQVGARGSVDLDVEFGSKEHVDRIVALSEEYQKRGERGSMSRRPHIDLGADTANTYSYAAAMTETLSENGLEQTVDQASSGGYDGQDHEMQRSNSRTSTRYSSGDSDVPSEWSSDLERLASIDVLKLHAGSASDQVTYIGGLSATKGLVPRMALIGSGFRILRSSERSWHAVPTKTMHVGSEKGSTRAIAKGILALSQKCREGKCVEVSVFPSCPAEIENSEEIL